MKSHDDVILQPQITLNEAVISGFSTYKNGCNFALEADADGKVYLRVGCYLLTNLMTKNEHLIYSWLGGSNRRLISGVVHPNTIRALFLMPNCKVCGGFTMQARDHQPKQGEGE